MIWVLSEYERGQIYDLPEEDTSQLTKNNNNNNNNNNNYTKKKRKNLKLNTKIKQRVKLCSLLFPLTSVLNVTFPNNFPLQ